MLAPAWVTDRTRDLHRTVLAAGKEHRFIHFCEDFTRPGEQEEMVISHGGELSSDEKEAIILLNDTWIPVAERIGEVLKIELMTP